MDIGLPGHAPAVTPSLAKKITMANFGHHNLDDLEAGIHPFLTTYKDPMTKSQLEAMVNTYDNLVQRVGAQLEDLTALKKGEVTSIPTSLAEITYTFKSFPILLYAILGGTHIMSNAWNHFLCQRFPLEYRCTRPHTYPSTRSNCESVVPSSACCTWTVRSRSNWSMLFGC